MSWKKAAIREDRQQAYYDSILLTVSEAGGHITRGELIARVAADLPDMGGTAWHVDRMVSAMLRGRCLVREGARLRLNSRTGDQLKVIGLPARLAATDAVWPSQVLQQCGGRMHVFLESLSLNQSQLLSRDDRRRTIQRQTCVL